MARSYDPAKEQFWRRVLARRQASGLTIRAYCEAHGLSEHNFHRWQRVLAERPGGRSAQPRAPTTKPAGGPDAEAVPLFVPLNVDIATRATGSALEVVLSSGRLIRVRPGFDAATLGQIVACLEGSSC
jgi:hypothetical protein